MKKSKSKLLLSVGLVSMLAVTACSNAAKPEAGSQPAASSNGTAAAADTPSAQTGKYNPPIDMSTFRCMTDGTKYPSGDSIDNNVWYRAYDQELGIKLTNKWTVSTTQCEQKTNLSIVSGDLPDFFPVNAKQLKTLVDAGQVEDMTDVINKYASPLVKDFLTANNSLPEKAATYNGKVMALPGTTRGLNNVDMVWIREDWKKKLNLPDPKTMDDVLNIINAFHTQDPDGDGKSDTYGLNLTKDFWGGYSGLEGFFNSYHAYPFSSSSTMMFVKDKDGNLAYGGIQPEMKPALLALQKLYQSGAIDPQFVVYDAAKSAENENQGKTGVHFGYFWNIGWPIDGNTKKSNPSIEWKPYPIVSIDSQPAKPGVTDPSAFWFFAVKKGTKHPEAVVKMMNLFFDHIFSDHADPAKYHTATIDGTGYGVFEYAAVQGEHPEKNQIAFQKVSEAMKSGDATKLNPEQKSYYDQLKKYNAGDLSFWGADRTWGPEGSFSVLGKYKDNNLMNINAFNGAPTPTMGTKGSLLADMEQQMITKIILGGSIDLFDQFVTNWKQSGGDQITKEVNDWYKNNK